MYVVMISFLDYLAVWFWSELVWVCSFMSNKKNMHQRSMQPAINWSSYSTADAKLQHRVVWGSWSHWSNLSLRWWWSLSVIFVFHWFHVSFQYDVSFIIKLKRKKTNSRDLNLSKFDRRDHRPPFFSTQLHTSPRDWRQHPSPSSPHLKMVGTIMEIQEGYHLNSFDMISM